ncbi:BcsE family c-di-GMP-binding protein [Erwinia mallotivora]|uniref:BcsE family c-di-GMP-binding protein n=1 Tax=Erwinia mallotivora TaxID=69222 RepID=UPI0035E96104
MVPSFTLGFGQVRDELMLMQSSGCYWLTANREEDARLLLRDPHEMTFNKPSPYFGRFWRDD